VAKKKWHTADLYKLLEAKYPHPQYAFIGEVPNGTSYNKTRSADALAMGCWQSVGIHLSGFEIKISRSDWRKELNDLSKALAFQQHCHRWWIVAAPGIVKLEEMPAEWGLLEPHGSGLRVKRAASLREPECPDFGFIAGMLRRTCEVNESKSEIKKAHDQGYRSGHMAGKASGELSLSYSRDRYKSKSESLEEDVKRFEEQSGFSITDWDGRNVGKIVKLLQGLNKRHISLSGELEQIINTAGKVVEVVNEMKSNIGLLEVEQESN